MAKIGVKIDVISHFSDIPALDDALPAFKTRLFTLIDRINPALYDLVADHIALRCHHPETAARWRREFLQKGRLLTENMINGRPICVFELDSPICVGHWHIDCVELPYPTQKTYPQETWEHVELVLPVVDGDFHPAVLALIPPETQLQSRGIIQKWSQPKGNGERLPNPTLALSDGIVTVKIHPHRLRDVIASER